MLFNGKCSIKRRDADPHAALNDKRVCAFGREGLVETPPLLSPICKDTFSLRLMQILSIQCPETISADWASFPQLGWFPSDALNSHFWNVKREIRDVLYDVISQLRCFFSKQACKSAAPGMKSRPNWSLLTFSSYFSETGISVAHGCFVSPVTGKDCTRLTGLTVRNEFIVKSILLEIYRGMEKQRNDVMEC